MPYLSVGELEAGLALFSSFAYDQEGFIFDCVREKDASQLETAYPAGDFIFTQCVEDFSKFFHSIIGIGVRRCTAIAVQLFIVILFDSPADDRQKALPFT